MEDGKPKELIKLEGLKTGYNFESLESGSKAFTVTSDAIVATTTITVTAEDYALTFATDASVLLTSDNTSIIGSGGNDSIALADNLSVISGSVSIDGANGNDVFTLSNISIEGTSGALAVLGGAGADTFTLSNISVGGGTVNIYGGADADSINLTNISVASGAFNVYGGTGSGTNDSAGDFFNISNSTGLSIISGEGDSDTFAIGGNSVISLTGLDTSDLISVASASNISLHKDGLLVLGSASIYTGQTSDSLFATNYDNVSITTGAGHTSILADIIDKLAWSSINSGGFQYERPLAYSDTAVMSISNSRQHKCFNECCRNYFNI